MAKVAEPDPERHEAAIRAADVRRAGGYGPVRGRIRIKYPGMWAGLGSLLLVVTAPIMLFFSAVVSISPPEQAPEAQDRLFGGAVVSVLGLVITAVLLLVAWLRPEEKRRAWRIAAFVVVVVALLIGPVWGAGSFFWVTNIG